MGLNMTDDDKALDKIIRASMPLDFERKETLSDDKALVERLRWSDGWFFENPWDHVVYASDDPLEAADRIEAQAAEIEKLSGIAKLAILKAYDTDKFSTARIEELTKALGWFVNDTRFVVQVGGNPNVVPGMIEAATKIYFGPDQKIYCGEDDD